MEADASIITVNVKSEPLDSDDVYGEDGVGGSGGGGADGSGVYEGHACDNMLAMGLVKTVYDIPGNPLAANNDNIFRIVEERDNIITISAFDQKSHDELHFIQNIKVEEPDDDDSGFYGVTTPFPNVNTSVKRILTNASDLNLPNKRLKPNDAGNAEFIDSTAALDALHIKQEVMDDIDMIACQSSAFNIDHIKPEPIEIKCEPNQDYYNELANEMAMEVKEELIASHAHEQMPYAASYNAAQVQTNSNFIIPTAASAKVVEKAVGLVRQRAVQAAVGGAVPAISASNNVSLRIKPLQLANNKELLKRNCGNTVRYQSPKVKILPLVQRNLTTEVVMTSVSGAPSAQSNVATVTRPLQPLQPQNKQWRMLPVKGLNGIKLVKFMPATLPVKVEPQNVQPAPTTILTTISTVAPTTVATAPPVIMTAMNNRTLLRTNSSSPISIELSADTLKDLKTGNVGATLSKILKAHQHKQKALEVNGVSLPLQTQPASANAAGVPLPVNMLHTAVAVPPAAEDQSTKVEHELHNLVVEATKRATETGTNLVLPNDVLQTIHRLPSKRRLIESMRQEIISALNEGESANFKDCLDTLDAIENSTTSQYLPVSMPDVQSANKESGTTDLAIPTAQPATVVVPLATTCDPEVMQACRQNPHYSYIWPCPYCPSKFELKNAYRCHLATAHKQWDTHAEAHAILNTKKIVVALTKKQPIKTEPTASRSSDEQLSDANGSGNESGRGRSKNPYRCPKCGRTCSSNTMLSDHVRGNCSRIPQYACTVCTKRFHSSSTLNCHMTIHTGEMPHQCPLCDKRFRTRGQLNVHNRKHTGERPFKCQICSQSFAHRETLISHLSRHIGMKRYKCYGCDKTFACISGLKTHREIRPDTCGRVKFNSRAIGPRVRVIKGNVIFEPQPEINPYLRTEDPQDIMPEIVEQRKQIEPLLAEEDAKPCPPRP